MNFEARFSPARFWAMIVEEFIQLARDKLTFAMPLQPIEVLIGKISPYIFVGYIQVGIIPGEVRYLFDVPI